MPVDYLAYALQLVSADLSFLSSQMEHIPTVSFPLDWSILIGSLVLTNKGGIRTFQI